MCASSSSRICLSVGISSAPVSQAPALAINASYRRTPVRSKASRSPNLSISSSGSLPRILSKVLFSMPLTDPGIGTEPTSPSSRFICSRAWASVEASPGTSAGRSPTYSTILRVSSGDIWAPVKLCPSLAALFIVRSSRGFAVQLSTGRPVITGGDNIRCDTLGIDMATVFQRQRAFLLLGYVGAAGGAQIGFFSQDLAYEVALTLELDHARQCTAQHFSRVAPINLLEDVAGHIQMAQLVIEEAFLQRLDPGVFFLYSVTGVGVALHRLVHQPLFHQALRRVHERDILSHVLLLHRGDFRVEHACVRIGEGRPDVHVV